MKKMMKVAAASVLAMGIAGSALAAEGGGSVSATVLAALTVQQNADISFGSTVLPGAGAQTQTANVAITGAPSQNITVSLSNETCSDVVTNTPDADAGFQSISMTTTPTSTDVGGAATAVVSATINPLEADGGETLSCTYTVTATY